MVYVLVDSVFQEMVGKPCLLAETFGSKEIGDALMVYALDLDVALICHLF